MDGVTGRPSRSRINRLGQLAAVAPPRPAASTPIAPSDPTQPPGSPAPATSRHHLRAGCYAITPDFGGHGIGDAMHEDPHLPNTGRPGRGLRLGPGLVIAIEPWFLAGGTDAYKIDSNGWAIRSTDGSHAAHVEHTIAVTDDGPLILTAPA